MRDTELKFGLAVVGVADPARLLTNAGARPGDRLLLTKPLGSGVLVNAFKHGRIDEAGLEPALREMERLNPEASRLALAHGASAATDVTGFGLAGHAWNIARESSCRSAIRFDALAVLPRFYDLVAQGVTTGCTTPNRTHAWPHIRFERALDESELQLLFDPQTSGPLLIALPADKAPFSSKRCAQPATTPPRSANVGRATPRSRSTEPRSVSRPAAQALRFARRRRLTSSAAFRVPP